MNVLVILEDALNDQLIAVPVIRAIFQSIGRPARVTAHQERMGGVDQAIDFERLKMVIEEGQGMVDLFLLLVDRDCYAPDRPRGGNRASTLSLLEDRIQQSGVLSGNQRFLASQAVEELEVWLLAGFNNLELPWKEIRDHCDPKEAFFEPFSKSRDLFEDVAEGRRALMQEAIARYKRIRHLCAEVQELERRVSTL